MNEVHFSSFVGAAGVTTAGGCAAGINALGWLGADTWGAATAFSIVGACGTLGGTDILGEGAEGGLKAAAGVAPGAGTAGDGCGGGNAGVGGVTLMVGVVVSAGLLGAELRKLKGLVLGLFPPVRTDGAGTAAAVAPRVGVVVGCASFESAVGLNVKVGAGVGVVVCWADIAWDGAHVKLGPALGFNPGCAK